MVTKRQARARVARVFDVVRLTDEELIHYHEQMFGPLTATTRKRFLDAARQEATASPRGMALAA